MSCVAQVNENSDVEEIGKETIILENISTIDLLKAQYEGGVDSSNDNYSKKPKSISNGDDPLRRMSLGKQIEKTMIRRVSIVDTRETWDNPVEFLLSCISLSVGLGNVWRFPAVAARNGGGAFLIPYLVVLLLIGRPLYYLEMCLGQFSRYGQVKVWNMAPIMKGIGYSALISGIFVGSYYCVLMGITLFYLYASFSNPLPWAICDETVYGNETCGLPEVQGQLAKLYYENIVFPQVKNLDNGLGDVHWKLVICLALSWALIFCTLARGVKSSGKVAYFTATFPYFVLLILLVRGVTLKGAWSGILYFITPQFDRLLDPSVWYAAIEQCLFSLGVGFGTIIVLSSYNPFNRNVYKDVLIITAMDTCTSLLAGLTVFSVMGYLITVSNEEYGLNMTFKDIAGGPALAFILYPQAIAEFGWSPQIFAVLFMFMMMTLALGSMSTKTSAILTIITDQWPSLSRWKVVLVICLFGFMSGLVYVTESGMLMLDLVDHYGVGIVIYIIAILECVGVAYVYGLSNICKDIEFMIGKRVGFSWRFSWGFVIPVGLFFNLLYYLATSPGFVSNGIPYPRIATVCGWLLFAFTVSLIPVCAVHSVVSASGKSLREKLLKAKRPTRRWGPQQHNQRLKWLQFKRDNK